MEENLESINIVICVDRNVVIPSLVVIRSVLDNTKSVIIFNVLLEQGLKDEYRTLINKNKFNAHFNLVEFIPPNTLVDIFEKYKHNAYFKNNDNLKNELLK